MSIVNLDIDTLKDSKADNWAILSIDISATVASAWVLPARHGRQAVLLTNTGTVDLDMTVAESESGSALGVFVLAVGAQYIAEHEAAIYFHKITASSGQKVLLIEEY